MSDDTKKELAAIVGPLAADVDTMREVYLTMEQQASLDRIIAAASRASDPTTTMFGRMVEANFPADTITLQMEPGYYAAAGRYEIRPAAPTAQGVGE